MLRMSRLTDYGLVLLTHMAQGGNPAVRTAQELARCSRVPLPTVSKILKELSKAGIVASQRGRHGGYCLARSPELISVAAVIEALEGPVALTECSTHDGACSRQPARGRARHEGGHPMSTQEAALRELTEGKYKYGFVTDVETDQVPKGLSEDVIRVISKKKGEPEWMLQWRLESYRRWLAMVEPTSHNVHYPKIDYQDIVYYSAPKPKKKLGSLDEVDPELRAAFEKLGIPLAEQARLANVAVDAVFDSVSVATTFKGKLAEKGVIFCSFSEAVKEHPELVRKYLGSVVPQTDNFFASLNSAVFSDGSFAYIPKGVRCPMELSTYFRINASDTGQFERTLIVADEGSYVSYLEGCTAPVRDENQLHAAVVELVSVGEGSQIKYSTVQNWYPGDKEGKGGIYNFVTKRGACRGRNSKISWTQVETGSAI